MLRNSGCKKSPKNSLARVIAGNYFVSICVLCVVGNEIVLNEMLERKDLRVSESVEVKKFSHP